jgi:hypothetical protein
LRNHAWTNLLLAHLLLLLLSQATFSCWENLCADVKVCRKVDLQLAKKPKERRVQKLVIGLTHYSLALRITHPRLLTAQARQSGAQKYAPDMNPRSIVNKNRTAQLQA